MANTLAGGEKRWLNGYADWVKACHARHGGRYQYTSDRFIHNGVWKVTITCPEHGPFVQAPAKHKFGQGCPACSGNVQVNMRERLAEAFPDQPLPEHLPATTKELFEMVCPEHGTFQVTLNQLLATKAKAQVKACPQCNVEARGKARRNTETLEKLKALWPTYTFDCATDIRTSDKVQVHCPDHGLFLGRVGDMLLGHGCPGCGQEARNKGVLHALGVTVQENLDELAVMHGGRLIPIKKTIGRTHERFRAICPRHGAFESSLYSVKAGHGCPRCTKRVSKGEQELATWLRSLGVTVEIQVKYLLERGEIDIYLPDHGLAIEYCGLYWHGEEKAGRLVHASKMKDAGKAGVRLITLFEDEWLWRSDTVKHTLRMALGLVETAQARKLALRKATWAEVAPFYEAHHLQGAGTPCAINYVLADGEGVVAAMSFKADRFGDHDYELIRYTSSKRVTGGFARLLAAFRSEAQHKTLVSYCDQRWFSGQVYARSGFQFAGDSGPGYWWCKSSRRYSRQGFQKHKLAKRLENFDPALSEAENMRVHGFWKIWDCGMSKWVLENV